MTAQRTPGPITLPTWDECHAVEAADRTALQAFIYENSAADAKQEAEFRHMLLAMLTEQTDSLLQQRDELAEALRGLVKFVEDECLPDSGQAVTDASAALAKVSP
jgi:hypothetical protein